MKHEKRYVGQPNGGGKIVCPCGFETPVVDDASMFTLGIKSKTVDDYFEDHMKSLAPNSAGVQTTMTRPAAEHAVAVAQRPISRIPKILNRKKSGN